MFKNVVVGVDGKPMGRDAVALAGALAQADGKVTLVNVHSGELHPLHAVTPGFLEEEQKASHQLLEAEREHAGIEADLVSIVAPSPGGGLHRQAEEMGADLIVVGSCSRGLLGRAMLGDDARAALNGAPCAVAIAARGYSEHPLPIGKVGVAYNASEEAQAALEAARGIASERHGVVNVREIVSIPTYAFTGLVPPAFGETVDLMLREANERLAELEGVEARAVYGLPGEELAEFGDEVDLLVVGSRSYGPVKRLVLGSTSDYLERHARCSLLVLPRSPGD